MLDHVLVLICWYLFLLLSYELINLMLFINLVVFSYLCLFIFDYSSFI